MITQAEEAKKFNYSEKLNFWRFHHPKDFTMTDLEHEFHYAMLGIYTTAKSDCNYHATYFMRMVTDYGGLEAARRLLATNQPSDGFTTLWMCGRLDLTVEAHVIRPEFEPLFTPVEIAVAQARLKEYGYAVG